MRRDVRVQGGMTVEAGTTTIDAILNWSALVDDIEYHLMLAEMARFGLAVRAANPPARAFFGARGRFSEKS